MSRHWKQRESSASKVAGMALAGDLYLSLVAFNLTEAEPDSSSICVAD